MKKTILSLLVTGSILAYQPATPAPAFLTHPPESVEAQPQIGLVPAVAIGAVVVGGVAWVGFKVMNRIMNIWERQVTNTPPPGVVFTLPPEPQQPLWYEGEESGQ